MTEACVQKNSCSDNPSICIPRTFSNITAQHVKNTFEQIIGNGTVERVDMVQRRGADGDSFQRVFVHFKHWPDHPEVTRIREKLLRGDEIKLVYNEPWFWKCRKSTASKPRVRKPRPVPYIKDLSDSDNDDESRCTLMDKLKKTMSMDKNTSHE